MALSATQIVPTHVQDKIGRTHYIDLLLNIDLHKLRALVEKQTREALAHEGAAGVKSISVDVGDVITIKILGT